MKNQLHSIYIKHDTSFKSLTKRALAQILIKIIYKQGQVGIHATKLKLKLQEFTGVSFKQTDIDSALIQLRVQEKKVNTKSGKHYIKVSYLDELKTAEKESKDLHNNVLKHWFSESATIKDSDEGRLNIENWFKETLVSFFQEYSYDWINDLRVKKNGGGQKKKPNLSKIVAKTLNESKIHETDHDWLKQKFENFIASDRKQDQDLIWTYGSSMFTSALLTARNYADDISMDIFRNSQFILDTNMLMIVGLEGFDKNYAVKALEEAFVDLEIEPGYFHISKEEYQRALAPKHEATLAAVEKYDHNVIRQSDCPFIQTAIKRQCTKPEDFDRFFQGINNPPKMFSDKIPLECFDYKELNTCIEKGIADQTTLTEINRIHKIRTNREKRDKPKEHDAGLIFGANYLREKNNAWILTRDGTLREYAFQKTVRDNNPIAIGLDSLIQMLAIESGGSQLSSTNFAPLFSKIVSSSIMPDRDIFQMEDLYFIEKSHIEISKLSPEKAVAIAKLVNKLRLRGVPDEDIVLEIQRSFQASLDNLNSEFDLLKSDKNRIEKDFDKQQKLVSQLKTSVVDSEIENRINKVRDEVRGNWYKLLGIPIVLAFLIYGFMYLDPSTSKSIDLSASVLTEIIATLVIAFFSKWKLIVRQIDKDNISKEVKAKYQ